MAKGNQGNRQTTGTKAAPRAASPGAARPGIPPTPAGSGARQMGTGTTANTTAAGNTLSHKATPTRTNGNGNGSAAASKVSTSRPATTGTAVGTRTAGTTATRPAVKPSAARAAVRAEQQRHRQRHQASRPWWRGPIPIIGTVVTVGLIVVLFIVLGNQGGSVATQPAPPAVFQQVTNVSPTVASTVGTGGLPNPLHATAAGTPILKGAAGKPEVLYIGAEFCPYCAAERWSMVVALSRFGTFSTLNTTTSSASDAFPSTNTFTFYKSNYTSTYIDFQAVEQTTNQPDALSPYGYKTLQVQTQAQQNLMDTYDAPPYASQPGIPFIDFGNQLVAIGPGFTPQVLQGQTWQEIASALSNAQSPMTQYIVGNANYLTAAICQATNNQPASVCGTATIKQIQGQLAQLPKGQ